MQTQKWTLSNLPDLTGKTVIVTGGNSGLGYVSATALAANGAQVVIACRSLAKGKAAAHQIQAQHPKAQIKPMPLDLMDLTAIDRFASQFKKEHDRLDILMNNAGIMAVPYALTTDGFESQIGTNHLGHFALTGLLLDVIAATPQSRVVTVSSLAHKQGRMDFENLLFFNAKGYSPWKAYSRSKLANLLFSLELQRFFESSGMDSLAVCAHPGVSQTNLSRYIEKQLLFRVFTPMTSLIFQNAAMGALPQIRAAVDPEAKGGQLWGPNGFLEMTGYPVLVEPARSAYRTFDANKLWEASESLTQLKFKSF